MVCLYLHSSRRRLYLPSSTMNHGSSTHVDVCVHVKPAMAAVTLATGVHGHDVWVPPTLVSIRRVFRNTERLSCLLSVLVSSVS